MSRPRLLDLFCCGGGASAGYTWAGFDVVGVDWVRQPDYPYEFHLADAMTFPLDGFDAIHASPPCERFTTLNKGNNARHLRLFDWNDDLLTPTLKRFATVQTPWVVENVMGAAELMPGALMLCGSSFGLDVQRHRLFASNVALTGPPCNHESQEPGRFLPTGRNVAATREGRQNGSRVVGNYGHLNLSR